jgi:3-oxoacyl-[acyl-carrier-protein] synthase-3
MFLSKPGVIFPSTRVDNAEIVRRVRDRFPGTDAEFVPIQAAIGRVFRLCGSKYRYLDPDPNARVADYAVRAAKECLELNGASLDEVDLVVCGGIARQYFEPATAMEVAAKLGIKKTHAFDVTAACVGHLEAIQVAAAYQKLHPEYRTALVCTAELCGNYISYDVQRLDDLYMKSAGLTIGNAAACVLLRATPFPRGGMRLDAIHTTTVPNHWDLCQVPIDGKLMSSSVELMRLGEMVPPWVTERLAALALKPSDIDHYVLHQPSEAVIRKIIAELGVDTAKGVYTHSLYGNTASASVAVGYRHLLDQGSLRPGDKVLLGSAAAGFSMVMAVGEWMGPGVAQSSPGEA